MTLCNICPRLQSKYLLVKKKKSNNYYTKQYYQKGICVIPNELFKQLQPHRTAVINIYSCMAHLLN